MKQLILLTLTKYYASGEIFVKKIPSMKIIDVARAINNSKKLKIVGMRDGEKIHEQMITPEDSKHTLEFKDFFIISSETNHRKKLGGKKVKSDFSYDSKNNKDWMNITQLKNLLKVRIIILSKILLTGHSNFR